MAAIMDPRNLPEAPSGLKVLTHEAELRPKGKTYADVYQFCRPQVLLNYGLSTRPYRVL
jgi:hypothetical protein